MGVERTGDAGALGARHFVTLDALRGIAAIVVLIFHVAAFVGYPLSHAYQAVDFFFVLSGFVIGLSYEDKLRRGLSVGRYMRLRVWRMYPALAPGLALGLAMTLLGHGLQPFTPVLLLNLMLIPVFMGGSLFPLNGPMWSLFYELAANLGHAALLPWLSTGRLWALAILSGALLVLVGYRIGHIGVGWKADHPWSFIFLAGFVRVGWGFFAGLLIYRLVLQGTLRVRPWPVWLAPAALAALLLLPNRFGLAQHLFLALVAFPALLLIALGREPEGPWRRGAKWLGGISYPLYATHATLLLLAEALSPERDFGTPAGMLYWITWVVLALLLATAVERYYDAPIRAWLRRRRIGGHALAPAA